MAYLLTFAIMGTIWYALDNYLGIVVYTFFYNLSSKEKLPEGKALGFIVNQKARGRFYAALPLGLFNWWLITLVTNHSIVINIFLCLLSLVSTMTGFYCGPWLLRLLPKLAQGKEKIMRRVDAIDRIESGEIDVVGIAGNRARSWMSKISGGLTGWKNKLSKATSSAWPAKKPIAPAPTPTQVETSAVDIKKNDQPLEDSMDVIMNELVQAEKTANSTATEEATASSTPLTEDLSLIEAQRILDEFNRGQHVGGNKNND